MQMTPEIKYYKKLTESMDYKKMRNIINNSRLTKEERMAVQLADLEETPNKISADRMNTTERQFNSWLHSARVKIMEQIYK